MTSPILEGLWPRGTEGPAGEPEVHVMHGVLTRQMPQEGGKALSTWLSWAPLALETLPSMERPVARRLTAAIAAPWEGEPGIDVVPTSSSLSAAVLHRCRAFMGGGTLEISLAPFRCPSIFVHRQKGVIPKVFLFRLFSGT